MTDQNWQTMLKLINITDMEGESKKITLIIVETIQAHVMFIIKIQSDIFHYYSHKFGRPVSYKL